MRNIKDNAIGSLTFNFSLQIIDFVQQLKSQKDWDLASQLFRSGTSIGGKRLGSSKRRKHFIHKFKIGAKESDESEYCWNYVKHQNIYPPLKNRF